MNWPMVSQRKPSEFLTPTDEWGSVDEVHEDNISPPELISPPLLPIRNSRRRQPTPELSYLQRNIRRMDAASSKIVLERLKEEWLEVADACVYRELELEKQLWMLTVLQHLKKKSSMDLSFQIESMSLDTAPGATKLLSLYENHGKQVRLLL